MSSSPGPVRTAAALPGAVRVRSGSAVTRALNVLGIVVVAYWSVRTATAVDAPVWVWVTGAVALAAWVLRVAARSERVLLVAAGVMVVAGAAVVVPTVTVVVAVPLVGVVVLGASALLPTWTGPVAATVALVEVAGTAVPAGAPVTLVLGIGGGLLLAAVVGFSRHQARLVEDRTLQAEVEQQRAELLADRSRTAREVHDVLAHSLGGLVLQLDAVEALLEAGRVEEATRRAGAARALAASGLAEARRAVHALRDDTVGPVGPPVDLTGLVDAHRAFGGTVTTHGDLALTAVDAAHRDVVVAAGREALSNARRHAPGRPVVLSVDQEDAAVRVTVTNPLDATADPAATASGAARGHGTDGMRERFAELGDDSSVTAGAVEGSFVVTMRVPTPSGEPGVRR
ncbi:histidine kinase [Curtobacterium sp. MCSS17_007]|uniref:sensor histidine kinase n=1 Tax=Curtobacterium sp. MCSS17_007 TaxID=2175646 RepID=UPI0011B7EBFE|nr:histidine kinase [Curtobacterium sp. MCSS17_007]WIE75496.1 histidine kinase [Curtobacterium sp. MCSS17_007]